MAPEPTRDHAQPAFATPDDGEVRIEIRDAGGPRVAALTKVGLERGAAWIDCYGVDGAGRRVGAGVHVAEICGGGRTGTGAVLMLRRPARPT